MVLGAFEDGVGTRDTCILNSLVVELKVAFRSSAEGGECKPSRKGSELVMKEGKHLMRTRKR